MANESIDWAIQYMQEKVEIRFCTCEVPDWTPGVGGPVCCRCEGFIILDAGPEKVLYEGCSLVWRPAGPGGGEG